MKIQHTENKKENINKFNLNMYTCSKVIKNQMTKRKHICNSLNIRVNVLTYEELVQNLRSKRQPLKMYRF